MSELHLYNLPGLPPDQCGWMIHTDYRGNLVWVGTNPNGSGIETVSDERMQQIIQTTGCVPLMTWEVDLYNGKG